MRKFRIYGLLACLCLMMQSCLFSEKDIFDESSAERAIGSVNECQEILKSAPNGWLLEYYTGEDAEYGGFNILAKFDGKNVSMAAEVATANYAVGEISTTLYKVDSYQGTELSFDSYSELIHQFCEPNSFTDPGYAGDYEFVIRSASKDKIVLTGKKHGVMLVMTPLPEDLNWQDYLTKVATLADDAGFSTYKLKVKGKEIASMGQNEHAFIITDKDATGTVTMHRFPFIYTSEGVKLFEPMTVGGVTMHAFKWDSEAMVYTCTDPGVDAKIEFFCPEGYYQYLGNYIMTNGAQKIPVSLQQKRLGKSYVMTLLYSGGAIKLDLVFDYNLETGCIDVMAQKVGIYEGFDVYFYPGAGNNFYPAMGYGFLGKVISAPTDPLKISFTFNKNEPAINSIFFLYEDGGWYLLTSIVNPTLTKIN